MAAENKRPTLTFNVIITYDGDKGQDILDIELPKGMPEDAFVLDILSTAGWDMAKVTKISTFLTGAEGVPAGESLAAHLPAYLHARNGKYYFNTDINKDADTARWRGFRDGFLLASRKVAALRAARATAAATAAANAATAAAAKAE